MDYINEVLISRVGICLIRNNEMTLPYVLFEFLSAELPFLMIRRRTTQMIDDSFLVGDEQELMDKLESFKDDREYEEAVEKARALKQTMLEVDRLHKIAAS